MRRMTAALLAIREQVDYFHQHFGRAETLWKHDGTRVTPADLAVSEAIFAALRKRFPEDQFFSEESDPEAPPTPVTARFAWMLDPIDGTNNFAIGIPFCSISLALLDRGVPVCGFLYDFGLRALFHGGPAIGLFRDGQPIEREEHPRGAEKILALHAPIGERYLPVVSRLISGYKLRAWGAGSLHLAYVAFGKIDAAVDLTVKAWDIVAAWAFCQTTGVRVEFLDGSPFPLKAFDVHMQPTRYVAAPPEEFAALEPELHELRQL